METESENQIRVYDLPREMKGLIVFFILFSTYCVISGEHGFRSSFESYLMFALVWAIFLFQIYKIEIINERIIKFHRVAKNTQIEIQNVQAIVEGLRYYKLHHSKGTLYLDHFISNIESFKKTIILLNPAIKTEDISLKNFYKDWWSFGYLLQFFFIVFVFIFVFYLLGSNLLK